VNGTCNLAGLCQSTGEYDDTTTNDSQHFIVLHHELSVSCACATCFAAAGGLTINVGRVAVGSNERLIFTAKFASNTVGKTIKLYQSASPGLLTTYVLQLMDDGSFAARDATANDGTFSNTLSTADCTAEKDIHFSAVIDGQPSPAEVLTAKVHCFTPPTIEQAAAGITQASTINTQLAQQVNQGSTVSQALSAVATILRTTSGLDPTTIVTTGIAVIWSTSQGLRFRAYTSLPGQRAAPASAPVKDYVHGPPYIPHNNKTRTSAAMHLPRPLAVNSSTVTTSGGCVIQHA
jgi:hypothetical protein